MGDVSIIARRLSDKYVQYGWSGNGGYFKKIGDALLSYYTDPEMVEYLFELGQVATIWEPYSERTNRIFKTEPTGRPHWVGTSERKIFSQIAFVDYGYFYDSDNIWYYVIPGPFRIKMPLVLIANNLDENHSESAFVNRVEHMVFDFIFEFWFETDEDYRSYLNEKGYDSVKVKEVRATLAAEMYPIYRLFDRHNVILDYFDSWALIRSTEDNKAVGEIIIKKKTVLPLVLM